MAKFLKNIFQSSDKKRNHGYEGSSEEDYPPPLEGRRKLSVSRSGRMRQAQKKRLSLSLEIYGDNPNLHSPDKAKSVEYHVNPTTPPAFPRRETNQRRRSGDSRASGDSAKVPRAPSNSGSKQRRLSTEIKTPDEEIDIAFEIIDKS